MSDIGISPDGHFYEIRDDGSTGHKIETVYAILSVDKQGGEGIVGLATPAGWIPMVTSNKELIEGLAVKARNMAEISRVKAVLVEFTSRTEMRTLWDPDA